MKQQNGKEHCNPWLVEETSLNTKRLGCNESIFALANGALGFRGDFEEGYPGDNPGVYLNGFYESEPIQYGELAFGYAKNSQTMLNVANAKRIRIYLDKEELCLAQGKTSGYKRTLNMQTGLLTRSFTWCSENGKKAKVSFERMVLLDKTNTAFIRCEVCAISNINYITLQSEIDTGTKTVSSKTDPRIGAGFKENPLITKLSYGQNHCCGLAQYTKTSKLGVGCAVCHTISAANAECTYSKTEKAVGFRYRCKATQPVALEKFIAYSKGTASQCEELMQKAQAKAEQLRTTGIATAKRKQIRTLTQFWKSTGISIDGENALTQGLHFNLYQVFQSVGRDGKTNISAKGLSGGGYEGHYFWDTETYVFPMFLYTMPKLAKNLLMYRYSILNKARERAREMGHTIGALFPWRTINGEECSAYYPAGSAQYHINADIANAICLYADATHDEGFMRDYGVEILIETARLWHDIGFYNSEKGNKFCINCVTGPDEYNVLVNNNCYTNMMAAYNLKQAAQRCEWLKKAYPQKAQKLFSRIKLSQNEPSLWQKAGDTMYVPFDEITGAQMQDDEFNNRKPWPIQSIAKQNFPLLLHYHPLVIYRAKICKQADLVLATLLRSENFTARQKQIIFNQYELVTTHDSSLSKAVFSIIASEIGYTQQAYDLFASTARMDLDDEHNNSQDGLHMANMAGAWMDIVYGFGGMRVQKGALSLAPFLPKGWREYSFHVRFQSNLLSVTVCKGSVCYELKEGSMLSFSHHGKELQLTSKAAIQIE